MMTMKLLYYDDGIVQPMKLFNTVIIFEQLLQVTMNHQVSR